MEFCITKHDSCVSEVNAPFLPTYTFLRPSFYAAYLFVFAINLFIVARIFLYLCRAPLSGISFFQNINFGSRVHLFKARKLGYNTIFR